MSEPPPVSNRDTLQIVRTIRAAYDAAETGRSRKIEIAPGAKEGSRALD